MKKTIAILLCLVMLLGAFAGCGPAAQPTPSPSATPVPSPSATPSSKVEIKEDMFAQDTVMFTVDGDPVDWEETLYWTMWYVTYLTGGGVLKDWTIEYTDGVTVQDFIKEGVLSAAAYQRNVAKQAALLDVKLSSANIKLVEDNIQNGIKTYGSQEAFEAYLKNSFLDIESYREMLHSSLLSNQLFDAMYGEKGANYSDVATQAYGDESGLVRACHILINTKELDEAGKTAARQKIQGILDDINAADNKKEAFLAAMKTHSEDPGVATYPDGYMYLPGTMVTEFESAAKALELNGVSGIVESIHGYHIILRLPLDLDAAVFGDNTGYTLRQHAATEDFDTLGASWYEDTKVELTDDYKNFSLNKLFVIG